ncbi:MAG: hypothetical protein A4E19_13990 [Nitrospira sp. SG-bin1]|nr:MAG: hypothetical protein A4E19_13990 [Nitrospira sp. SG-bin1]
MPEPSLSVEHGPWSLRSEDRLSAGEFRDLVCHMDGPCASLFMPTHRGGPQVRQDPIRLKNLARAAEQSLIDKGYRSSDVRSWLASLSALETDDEFWRYQSEGLAVFVTPTFVRLFRLPLRFDESIIVSDRFHVSPLLPYFTEDERFYLLSLSQNGCRLLRCTRNTVTRVDLPGAPPSMTETPGYERRETQLQFEALAPRGSGGTGSGGGTALFHGHGSSSDVSTADVERYFRAVDRAVCDVLHDRREPLVLAGVDYLLPLYKTISQYGPIASEALTGNYEERRDEELRRDAWHIMESRLMHNRRATLEQVNEAVATGRGSDRLEEVVPAAVQGRVDMLVIPVDRHAWGRFDPDRQQAEVHDEPQTGDEDLYELAVVQTFLHRGQVFPAKGTESLAARFRY